MIRDTTAAAARVQWDAYASMTGEQRLRQALELTDFVLKIRAEGRAALAARSRYDELRPAGASPPEDR